MNKLKNINPNGELLTYKQTAEKCNIGEKTVMKLAKEAKATVKIGHISRVNWNKFYNYILKVYQGDDYGIVYQNVTRNSNISAVEKGIYAYLASLCGASDECCPNVETITKEMGIAKDTFYKHINSLVEAGIIEKHQTVDNDGKFGIVVYRIIH